MVEQAVDTICMKPAKAVEKKSTVESPQLTHRKNNPYAYTNTIGMLI
jgi:hypothetical protein